MEFVGFALALVMGFTLGLFGGGGSVLTVPIMVYVLGLDPVLGTAYSLFVVGATAVLGGWRKHFHRQVDWKTGLIFAIPSFIAVFVSRYYLVPAIPDTITSLNGFTLTKDIAMMVFFALVMLLTSYSMIRGRIRRKTSEEGSGLNIPILLLEGFIVGIVTGLVGAGGGFLIVPALVLLVNMPIKKAIGTSLVIIAIKSLIGFLGDVGSGQDIDWLFLFTFTAFSMMGMLLGIYATQFVKAEKLKKGFGVFLLVMGILIILKETVFA